MLCLATSLLLCTALLAAPAASQNYPFRNTSLPFDERVKDLVGRLSLDEMVAQMSHGGASNNGPAPAISRLEINPYQWGTECLSGDVQAGPATSFPISIGMAATFNYKMVYNVAKATSDEVRSKNNYYVSQGDYSFHTGLSCWSPVINILRDPRWGRNQETYGEDPWLSGYLARAYVTGLQGNNSRYLEANAGCKHFDVHGGPENIPVSRFSFNSVVSTRDWRMTFLPQFRECVAAGSWSLMCSYNSINGIPACANDELLTDILRNEWGFPGYVVSDQGAIELVWLGHTYRLGLLETAAVCANAGVCLEDTDFKTFANAFDRLGDAVTANIETAHHYTNSYVTTAQVAVNAGTCLEDANMENNVFATIGQAVVQGLINITTVQDAVSRLFMVRMRLGEFDPPEMNPYTKLNMSDYIQSDAHRQLSLNAALETTVLLKNNQTMGMTLPITDPVSSACVVGPFISDVNNYFGDYSPTIMPQYVVTVQDGIKGTQIGINTLNFAEGCNDGPKCSSYTSSAVTGACNGVDLAIVCLGTGKGLESEGNDRADISLSGQQLQLLQDAANSAKGPVILVLYNAGPLDVSWAKYSDRVMAIVEQFFPAQTAGTALAEVLTGKYNPAGRLPNTWPASLDQVPPITNYTMVNRTYRYFEGVPLYPFGYGLSYTTFHYSALSVTPSSIKAGQNVTVKVAVTNTGKMDGDEVTQVYISWTSSSAMGIAPMRQLVATQRTSITAGGTVSLTLTITSTSMQLWTTQWETLPGVMDVFVGGQQPKQATTVPSNVLMSSFQIQS